MVQCYVHSLCCTGIFFRTVVAQWSVSWLTLRSELSFLTIGNMPRKEFHCAVMFMWQTQASSSSSHISWVSIVGLCKREVTFLKCRQSNTAPLLHSENSSTRGETETDSFSSRDNSYRALCFQKGSISISLNCENFISLSIL